jgi:hypothetical protein
MAAVVVVSAEVVADSTAKTKIRLQKETIYQCPDHVGAFFICTCG